MASQHRGKKEGKQLILGKARLSFLPQWHCQYLMPRQLVLYIQQRGRERAAGRPGGGRLYSSCWLSDQLIHLFYLFFLLPYSILSRQSNLQRRDNEATRRDKGMKKTKLTGTIRLVDHGLNDSTPGVDKPGENERKQKKNISPIINKTLINYLKKRKKSGQRKISLFVQGINLKRIFTRVPFYL